MPERAVIDEAMLLSQARLKVQDQDLKQGNVETITIHTVAGPMKRPWGIQGGFAVVYKFTTQSRKMRALRFFLIKMDPDIAFRYERIGAYFATHAPGISVEFNYHDSGIILKELVYGQIQTKSYPLIEMEWIDGLMLIEYVDELCQKRDTTGLADVVDQWCEIMTTMQTASISHGDLAAVNIMVRPNGRLVLVDYDGVYIPEFAGLDPIVLGQVDFQHPQMTLRPFNERTDDFSAWVIYTALLALQLQPGLWQKYMHYNAQGKLLDTNLLFRKDDFLDPDNSPLFVELSRIKETRLEKAVQILKQACKQPVANVPMFVHPDPDAEKKQALAKLEKAIQNNDEEGIVEAWIPQVLDNYGPAQQYVARVAQARQVVQALKNVQAALKTGSLLQIVNAFDPAIVNCKSFTHEQGEQVLLALELVQGFATEDDQMIVAAWQSIEDSRFKGMFILTTQEQQRLDIARQRKEALVKFRLALMKKNIQHIVASYSPSLLDQSSAVTARERELLQLAQDFAQAYQSNDDQAIVATSEAIQNFSHRAHLVFTVQEQQRIELAQQRKVALVKFRTGLMSKNMTKIVASYDWILDDCTSMTQQERDLVRLAKAFVHASYRADDRGMAEAWEAIQNASYQQFFVLSAQEQQRVDRFLQNKTFLPRFRQALASKNVRQIVADYDSTLDNDRTITQEERNVLRLARSFVDASQANDDQALASVWEEIHSSSSYAQAFIFTEQEQQQATQAQQRKAALLKFRMAIMSRRMPQILVAYDPVLDGCNNVTPSEQKQLSLARQWMQAYQRDDDAAILAAWAAIQNSAYQKFFILTGPEMQRIELAQMRTVK